MVLTPARRRWPLRIVAAIVLALTVAIGVPMASDSDAVTAPAAAAPSITDSIKECATNPLALMGGAGTVAGCVGAKKGIGAVKDAAGSGFQAIAKSFAQGWVKMIQLSLAWFIKIPTPQYASDSVIQQIQKATLQLQLFGLTLSILIGSWRLIMARRHAVMNEAQESFMGLAKAVFGAWMFGGVLTACTAGSDALSNWLLQQGIDDNENLLTNLAAANLVSMGSGLILVVAICGILGGIFSAVLLVGRQAMLAVVVAMIPLVGSFGGTQVGKMAFSRMVQWTIALLLWKPVAALVYWVAFKLAGHNVSASKDAQMALMGMILLSLTALVLPMLTRLVSGGAAMSGGGGLQAGMMTAGVVAAAGTMAATGGTSAAAGGASTASQAGAQMGPMAGPSGGGGAAGGMSGGTGSPGPQGSGGGGAGGASRGGTGSSGTSAGGRPGGGTGSPGSPTPPPPGAGMNASPAQGGGNSGSGTGGGGSMNIGDIAQAGSTAMSASQTLFDDDYESASLVSEGGNYR